LRSFWRVDKGNMSDTEAQLAALVLKDNQPHAAGTPENCRKFFNDSVSCQASVTCGWCQLKTTGFCFEDDNTLRSSCHAAKGAYVGPVHDELKAVTNEDVKAFYRLQNKQQQKGIDRVTQSGSNTFYWTIESFETIDSFLKTYNSPIFEHPDGTFWRLGVELPRKSAPPARRTLSLHLEHVPLDAKDHVTASYALKVLNQNAPSKPFNLEREKVVFGEGGRVQTQPAMNFESLRADGFLVKSTLKIELQFKDVKN